MKKILALALVAVMTVMAFAACGQAPAASSAAPAASEAGSSTAAPAGPKPLPAFSYLFNTTAVHQANAEVFQDSWKKAGFDVNIESQEWAVFQTSRTEGNYTVCRHGWLSDYSDAMSFLDLFQSFSTQNDPRFKSEEFDKLIETAKTSNDTAERMTAMHAAEKLLIDSYYVIPIYYYTDPRLDNGKVTGTVHDPLLNHMIFKWAKKDDGTEIKYALGATPKTLDPPLNNATDGANIIQQCFDGLTMKDNKNQVVPGLAEKWETSADGLTWTFHLRDAKWSDGKPITAGDFEYAWKRTADPATAAEYSFQMGYVLNGNEIIKGEKKPEELGVKAIDDKTLEVKLAAPCGYFTEIAGFPTYYPVRKDIIEANPGWAENPEQYITTGAYKLETFVPNDKLVLVKNDNYWDAANVTCPKLVNILTDDGAAAMNAFESGEIDIVEDFPPEETKRLKDAGKLFEEPSVGTYYVCVNAEAPEMQDIAVRKALSLSIDREYVCEVAQQGIPAYAFVAPGVLDVAGKTFREVGGDRLFGSGDPAKDLEDAKQILKDAGYAVAE